MDLFAGSAVKAFEGDGGSYSPWSESESPILAEAKVGAGKLLLHPLGFALPHYADSSKVGLVIQGDGNFTCRNVEIHYSRGKKKRRVFGALMLASLV